MRVRHKTMRKTGTILRVENGRAIVRWDNDPHKETPQLLTALEEVEE